VEEGRLALLAYLQPFGVDPAVINRIEVVLEEIVSNVVRHGQGADMVRIKARHGEDTIRLEFEDNGSHFDPFDAPEPEAFTTVVDAELGKQGIPLVKRLARAVAYERDGSMNRVTAIIAAQ